MDPLAALPTLQNVDGAQQRERAIRMMRDNFALWAQDPATLQERVNRECGLFPEGQLYPYFLTAIAFTHLAASEPDNRPANLKLAAQYLKLGIPVAGKIVNARNDDLLNLKDYDRQATTLSTVSIALGLYLRAGGKDPQLSRYHQHINQLLADALQRADGAPIHSYPNYSWNYDTVASLYGLRLAPELTPDISVDSLWKKHELWIAKYAFDEATQLPRSVAGFGYSEVPQPPRGCDVLMRVMMLGYLDPAASKSLFRNIRPVLERESGAFYGFDEYPPDIHGPEDNDSGPIVMDMGLSATGLAIGAALATDNDAIADRLCQQFAFREPLLMMTQYLDLGNIPGAWFWKGVKINPRYFTGFLFGDAVMFFTVTWAPVGEPG
ncbi:hypothetical protein [Cerasicoccus fimbriatus]|uniref:hypothetical protein n=1 Tax=Cerasicoccus fimbriatus TaxID=3014554 RepID=UPI0022B5B44D|nr:hypothetical protein [Cerasicoccus sp. TK19100]